MLTDLDVYGRKRGALEAGVAFRSEDVAGILSAAGKKSGTLPKVVSVDNGTEFTPQVLRDAPGTSPRALLPGARV